jgi:hypothetical protein
MYSHVLYMYIHVNVYTHLYMVQTRLYHFAKSWQGGRIPGDGCRDEFAVSVFSISKPGYHYLHFFFVKLWKK